MASSPMPVVTVLDACCLLAPSALPWLAAPRGWGPPVPVPLPVPPSVRNPEPPSGPPRQWLKMLRRRVPAWTSWLITDTSDCPRPMRPFRGPGRRFLLSNVSHLQGGEGVKLRVVSAQRLRPKPQTLNLPQAQTSTKPWRPLTRPRHWARCKNPKPEAPNPAV